jgi:hypothetical protein
MTASRDPERLIRAFLDEGVTELPDRVYDVVRSDIDQTRQRVVVGPWRAPDMNTFAKFAIAGAAVVVVALVGYNLLPAGGGNVGVEPAVSPSPSPSISPSPTAVPSPSPSDLTFFPDGSISAGRHSMVRSGKSFSVDMPSGWASHDGFRIYTLAGEPPIRPEAAFIFWTDPPNNVYADPCAHELLDPPAGDTPAELAAAVSSIPGTDLVDGPSDVTIGGHAAKLVTIRVREDVECGARQFFLWSRAADGPAGGRWPDGLGDTITTWIIDVDGTIVWIDGDSASNATPALQEQMRQIVESIQFE